MQAKTHKWTKFNACGNRQWKLNYICDEYAKLNIVPFPWLHSYCYLDYGTVFTNNWLIEPLLICSENVGDNFSLRSIVGWWEE